MINIIIVNFHMVIERAFKYNISTLGGMVVQAKMLIGRGISARMLTLGRGESD